MNITRNPSRITLGTLARLIKDLSRVRELGEASFSQSFIYPTKIIMKTPQENRIFQIQRAPNSLTREEFLQAIDEYLIEIGMYLADANLWPHKRRRQWTWLPSYRITGHLYAETNFQLQFPQ